MNQYVTGAVIKLLREKKHMTQSELAEKLCVSDKAISKWETGRGFPDIILLEELAKALGVSVPELLSGNSVENTNVSANMSKVRFCVCPVCGKHFWAGEDWGFVLFRRRGGAEKSGDIRVCSYTCLRRGREEYAAFLRKNARKRLRYFFRDGQTGETLSVSEAMERTALTRRTLLRAWHAGTTVHGRYIPVRGEAVSSEEKSSQKH